MSFFDWFKPKAAKRVNPTPATPRPEVQPAAIPATQHHLGYISVKDNISLVIDGRTHSIGRSHVNFDKIVRLLDSIKEDIIISAELIAKLESLINVGATVTRKTKGKVTVNEFGEVFHNGKPVHNVIGTRISEFVRDGLPFAPLARFLENLMMNPSERSIEQLYAFLEHGGFPITPDGCFLAYKGVTSDFKDVHTKSFNNSVGSTNEMPRERVDPDPNAACSVGFHVGTHHYAEDFVRGDGQLVMVKVNPADAVSVPHDHSSEKLRVCKYEVVAMCPGKVVEPLSTIGYQGDDLAEEDEFVEWEDSDEENDEDYYEENGLDDDILEEDEVTYQAVDEAKTGRKRGPGGRFLPRA